MERINLAIAQAMKDRNIARLESLRMIKSVLTKAEKDGTSLNEANVNKLLQKMVKQTEDAINQFEAGGRKDLADKEKHDLEVIKEFAPKEVSEEEIIEATKNACLNLEKDGETINMSVMKKVMGMVQEKFPTASGKIISQIVRNWKS